jgi:hypothetical protein
VHDCDTCPHKQEVPDTRDVSVPDSGARNESERLTHLSTQLDHEWLIPKSVLRFGGNVLDAEVGEARALWAKLRKKLEDRPRDQDTAIELLCVTFALHGSLPASTRAERMARRGLAESSAEAIEDPAIRQKVLYNVVIGAVRSGELDHARTWLTRLDPHSRSLDADSTYRVVAGALHTAQQDHQEVLKLLGRDDSIPIHRSSRTLAAVLRATALEKLGNLDAAVDCLYAQVLQRHSALAHIVELVDGFPKDWALCERSLPLVMERDKDRLAENIPAQSQAVAILVVLGLAVGGVGFALQGRLIWIGAAVALLCIVLAVVLGIRDRNRRLAIVRGSVAVRGRIRDVRDAGGSVFELDVTVEREGEPDARVTTLQPLKPHIAKMDLRGCSFDALWNPAHPSLFPRITIQVSAEAMEKAER